MAKKQKVKKQTKKTVTKSSVAPLQHPIQPLADRVLVRPFSAQEVETKNSFGIIIPDTVKKERPERGEVIAVGPGYYDDGKLIPVKVKVGDIVLFSKYGFEDISFDGTELYILKEESILAIIKK